jgi:long-chain fatty acid transport protein
MAMNVTVSWKKISWLGLSLLLFFAGRAHATNGAKLISSGAKSAGRGGTDVAVADTSIGISSNPAGMTQITGLQGDLVLTSFYGRTAFTNAYNDEMQEGWIPVAPALGIVVDPFQPSSEAWDPPEKAVPEAEVGVQNLTSERAEKKPATPYVLGGSALRMGLALFVSQGAGSNAKIKTPTFPEGVKDAIAMSVVTIAPAVAFRLTPRLSLGFTLQFHYVRNEIDGLTGNMAGELQGQVRNHRVSPPAPIGMTWEDLLDSFGAINSSNSTLIDLDDVWGYGFGGSIGLQYHLSDTITLGIAYTFKPYISNLKGKATVDASRAVSTVDEAAVGFVLDGLLPAGMAGGLRGKYRFTITNYSVPQSLAVGVAYRPTERLLLALDLKWVDWSNAFKTIKFKLKGGNNANINEIYGSSTITGEYTLRWRDMYVVSAGISYAVLDQLVLRAGYNYGNNPMPRRYTSPTAAGFLQNHGCCGLSYYYGRWSFDFAFVYSFPEFKHVGRNSFSPDYNNTRIEADQYNWYLGVSFRY